VLDGQARPQPPQFAGSFMKAVQTTPPVATGQFPEPAGHMLVIAPWQAPI
jgi:hypothetical protein